MITLTAGVMSAVRKRLGTRTPRGEDEQREAEVRVREQADGEPEESRYHACTSPVNRAASKPAFVSRSNSRSTLARPARPRRSRRLGILLELAQGLGERVRVPGWNEKSRDPILD